MPVLHEDAELGQGYLHLGGKLCLRRLPPVLLLQRLVRALRLRQQPRLAKRQPDRPSLIRHCALHGRADPPGGVGGESVAALRIKPVHRLQQTERSLLHEVLHAQRAPRHSVRLQVWPHDGDDQPHVRGDHEVARAVGASHLAAELHRRQSELLGPLLRRRRPTQLLSQLVSRSLVCIACMDELGERALLLRSEQPRGADGVEVP
mmetsp:Transcript_18902/g.32158  ORF Transcript_18902/g.32158 Transcript_18902/m.32158 type:complete len:205 (+) Transcript_18902:942-1556(+)